MAAILCPRAQFLSVEVGDVPEVAGPHPARQGVGTLAGLAGIGRVDRGEVHTGPGGQRVAVGADVDDERVREGQRDLFLFVRVRVQLVAPVSGAIVWPVPMSLGFGVAVWPPSRRSRR